MSTGLRSLMRAIFGALVGTAFRTLMGTRLVALMRARFRSLMGSGLRTLVGTGFLVLMTGLHGNTGRNQKGKGEEENRLFHSCQDASMFPGQSQFHFCNLHSG